MDYIIYNRVANRQDRTYTKRTSKQDPTTKRQWGIWRTEKNNAAVSQGSAIGAILFIIYLDDMMEAYTALNKNNKIPHKHSRRR